MASKDKIFLDTDVTLDHLADRQPFTDYVLAEMSVQSPDEFLASFAKA
jgi:hypothetical protein